jgi:hypothetical protein
MINRILEVALTTLATVFVTKVVEWGFEEVTKKEDED